MKAPTTAVATLIIVAVVFVLLVIAEVVLAVAGQGESAIATQLLLLVVLIGTAVAGTIQGGRIAYYQQNSQNNAEKEAENPKPPAEGEAP